MKEASSWLVLGAGTTGFGAALLLRKQGFAVVVSDGNQLPASRRQQFTDLGCKVRDGATDLSHLAGIDGGLVVSPGVAFDHPYLVAARQRGLTVCSEIDLALASYKGGVAAVTGTNGKSTTVAMLGYLLNRAGLATTVAGNIGTSPSQLIATGEAKAHLVLELSSYQLTLSERVAPLVAVLTNITPDHLARHGTLEAYLAAKWRIFAQQQAGDTAIICADAYATAMQIGLPRPAAGNVVLLTRAMAEEMFTPATAETELAHNRLNAAAAVLAAAAFSGQAVATVKALLTGFRGLEHRCEKIGTIEGRPIYNDSKATNVASTLVALQSLPEQAIVLIGGQGKGESFAPLAAEAAKMARVVAFGQAGDDVAAALEAYAPTTRFAKLADAMAALPKMVRGAGYAVLFSPACASFDEFTNFEERGRYFKEQLRPYLDS